MSWGEALRLTTLLSYDPSSQLAASLSGWEYAVSREALVLMDVFDLSHQVAWASGGRKGTKPKRYPRPWPSQTTTVAKPTVSQEVVLEALRMAGHGPPPASVTGVQPT